MLITRSQMQTIIVSERGHKSRKFLLQTNQYLFRSNVHLELEQREPTETLIRFLSPDLIEVKLMKNLIH